MLNRIFISLTALGVLASCGGSSTSDGANLQDPSAPSVPIDGGGAQDPDEPPEPIEYAKIKEASASGELSGDVTGYEFKNLDGRQDLDYFSQRVSGTFDNTAGSISFKFGSSNAPATKQFSAEETLSSISESNRFLVISADEGDGGTLIFYTDKDYSDGLANQYEYVAYTLTAVEVAPVGSGNRYLTTGVMGSASSTFRMEGTGKSASYLGSAQLFAAESGESSLKSSKSNLEVNFETAKAELTFSDFKALYVNGDNLDTDGTTFLDDTKSITFSDIHINDNRLENGRLESVIAGDLADKTESLFGQSPDTYVEGQFYGFDNDNNIPDEVGGVFNVAGDNAVLFGAFIGD